MLQEFSATLALRKGDEKMNKIHRWNALVYLAELETSSRYRKARKATANTTQLLHAPDATKNGFL